MLTNEIKNRYETWLRKATEDNDLVQELKIMDEKSISDAFYRDLEFGTGGLRGTIGAGTNRMNIYVVAKASQGLANYINENYKKEDRKVAISRDSRLKSDLFANVAAQVFAANGIKVYIYPYITPVPVLSYAVRYYKCAAGVMITASHNPSQYNGYKVYGSDGCQITTQAAKEILSKIDAIDIFNEVKKIALDDAFEKSLMEYIPPKVLTAFIEDVKKLSVIGDEPINKDFSIVYSPLHGAGLIPVTRILDETGYKNVIVVKEQQIPDGYFLTCPFPNPEIEEAMDLGMKYAEKYNADLLVATDPDCDRVGVAVKDKDNYRLITGNELGILLFNFICERLTANNKMPKNPVACDTIVTTDMGNLVADYYGVKLIRTLTGFKFIGEQIGILEQKGALDSFLFGFEESYGVLSGTHVRDKDAVNGTFLVCEMFAYYKTHGISLVDKLEELYKKFGYHYSTLNFFKFEGQEGFNKMQSLMDDFRNNLTEVAGLKVVKKIDYSLGVDNLPKSNVLKFYLEGNQCCIVRPSGTEPKLKLYVTARANSNEKAKQIEQTIRDAISNKIK